MYKKFWKITIPIIIALLAVTLLMAFPPKILPTPDKEVILKNTQITVTPEVRGTFITPTLTPKKIEKVILLPTVTE